ncbi:hypothetical protein ACFV6F_35875 [Kitasatospora phosalacinea]|uniref:hypothetical protein n=1 Tax=Kitasatospora phosalacinea TaxID=2065 RepID=UPI0036529152
MSNRLRIEAPASGHLTAEVRVWVDGEDLVAGTTGPGGVGGYAPFLLPATGEGPLRAGTEARRVDLGEPECTGGCRGHLTASVRRHDGLVVRADRETPGDEPRPPDLHFDAARYDAELARATADRRRDVPRRPDRAGARKSRRAPMSSRGGGRRSL